MDDTPTIGTVTPDDFRRIREVFELALQRPRHERRALVERACQGNTLLIEEVERMLAAEGDHHTLLDRRPRERAEQSSSAAPAICPSCRKRLEHTSRFCPSCGTPVGAAVAEEGRFRAGALFANRFRIVAALGRGGMGEVYRAHDLELGQSVALKFLTAFRSDERARARLRTEVRLARQIAHPNVCRVYDIGEANGELYLSMEFVDGEDLSALLKRIGRLPIDKGVEIARKLCAGLAAAHARGVLHRDLKPGQHHDRQPWRSAHHGLRSGRGCRSTRSRRRAERHTGVHGTGAVGGPRGHPAKRSIRAWSGSLRGVYGPAGIRGQGCPGAHTAGARRLQWRRRRR